MGRVSLLSFHLFCLYPLFVLVCNLVRGEAGFDSRATFGGVVVPLLGWCALALHFAFAYLPQKKENLPDAGRTRSTLCVGVLLRCAPHSVPLAMEEPPCYPCPCGLCREFHEFDRDVDRYDEDFSSY